MSRDIVLRIAAVAALLYYWAWPGVRLAHQYGSSAERLQATVNSLPTPTIQKVFVLPSYSSRNHWSGNAYSMTLSRNAGTVTVLIVGRHFKSLDEAHPDRVASATLGGQSFRRHGPPQPETDDSLMEIEVRPAILPAAPGQTIEVTVSREGKASAPFALTGADVSRQIAAARGTSPVVLDAVPVGYPWNRYAGESPKVLFIVAGWTGDEVTFSREALPCSFRVDGDSFDCHEHLPFRNLNFFEWPVHPGAGGHRVSLTLNGVESPVHPFDTTEFERYGKERQAARDDYYRSLSGRELSAGRQIPLIGQSKDGSLPSLAINVGLTLMALALLRPWRHPKSTYWVLSFVLPIGLQAVAGVLFGMAMLRGDFLAPVVGMALLVLSLRDACFPLVQAIVVAILLARLRRFPSAATP